MRLCNALHSALVRLALCALWLLAACSPREGKLTQVVVVIDAEASVAASLTKVEVATYAVDAVESDEPVTSGEAAAEFPFSVGVTKKDAELFLLVVTGYEGDERVIEKKVRLRFVQGEVRALGIYLARACYGMCIEHERGNWLTQTCRVQGGEGVCGAVERSETVRIAVGTELDAGLAVMDDAPIDAGSEVMDAAHDASPDPVVDATPDPDAAPAPTDYALGTAGQACADKQNQTLACEGHASRKVLKCNRGTWELFETCAETARCDSRVGPGQGTCVSIPAPCAGKSAGDVCDGKIKRACGIDMVSLNDSACQANAHCEDSGGAAKCACDAGYEPDGRGGCRNQNDCPSGACAGGRCVDGVSDYSCDCDSGFAGTGSKACTGVMYCPKDACVPGGTCVDVPNWFCHCGAGYAGEGSKACSNINDCPSDRCRVPNGACQDGINTYTCSCNPGFSGPDCQTDACSPNPCQRGGTCSRTMQGANCNCGASGYTGARCESDINECATTNLCTSVDYPCVQTAAPGYTCQGQFADWPMPDALSGSKVAPSYDTSTPGIVVDRVTGLTWQSPLPATYAGCSGQYTSGEGQIGDACYWSQTFAYCEGLTLAGRSDWRLPTKIELESIVDETRSNPAIDTGVFTGTPSHNFWTASQYVGSPGNAWVVSFDGGRSSSLATSSDHRVRCVR